MEAVLTSTQLPPTHRPASVLLRHNRTMHIIEPPKAPQYQISRRAGIRNGANIWVVGCTRTTQRRRNPSPAPRMHMRDIPATLTYVWYISLLSTERMYVQHIDEHG